MHHPQDPTELRRYLHALIEVMSPAAMKSIVLLMQVVVRHDRGELPAPPPQHPGDVVQDGSTTIH